jgi:hypothetical protein
MFDKVSKKVTDTAKAAAKKSGDLVEVAKLNLSIGTEEDKIKKVYIDLGKVTYETFTNGGEVDEVLKSYCEMIKSHEENIKDIKMKILELKDLKLCPGCGVELDSDFDYCSKCGAKQ